MNFSIILRRLNKLYENIGSNKKFGKKNFGKLRKRYQEQQKTGTVMQGIDSPDELFNHTKMLIKGISICTISRVWNTDYFRLQILKTNFRKILENGNSRSTSRREAHKAFRITMCNSQGLL